MDQVQEFQAEPDPVRADPGLEALKHHFKKSSVINQSDENLRPRVFSSTSDKYVKQEVMKVIQRYDINSKVFYTNFNNQERGTAAAQNQTPRKNEWWFIDIEP